MVCRLFGWLAGWLVIITNWGKWLLKRLLWKIRKLASKSPYLRFMLYLGLKPRKPFSIPQNFLQFSGPTSILHKLCERNFWMPLKQDFYFIISGFWSSIQNCEDFNRSSFHGYWQTIKRKFFTMIIWRWHLGNKKKQTPTELTKMRKYHLVIQGVPIKCPYLVCQWLYIIYLILCFYAM